MTTKRVRTEEPEREPIVKRDDNIHHILMAYIVDEHEHIYKEYFIANSIVVREDGKKGKDYTVIRLRFVGGFKISTYRFENILRELVNGDDESRMRLLYDFDSTGNEKYHEEATKEYNSLYEEFNH